MRVLVRDGEYLDCPAIPARPASSLGCHARNAGTAPAVREVIRHAGIGASNAIENPIKGDFGVTGIAVLAGFGDLFGLVKSRGVNEDNVLLFGSGIEEVAGHREGN